MEEEGDDSDDDMCMNQSREKLAPPHLSPASESRGALLDVGKRWAGEWNWHQKRRKVRQPRWWVWYHISPLSLPLLSPIPTHSHCCCSPIPPTSPSNSISFLILRVFCFLRV